MAKCDFLGHRQRKNPIEPNCFSLSPFLASLGSSHKLQWDKFCRECLNRKKFPVALAGAYIKNKTNLFRNWLEMSGDWDKYFDWNL